MPYHLLPDVLPAIVGLDQAEVAGAIVAADCEQLLAQDTDAWGHSRSGWQAEEAGTATGHKSRTALLVCGASLVLTYGVPADGEVCHDGPGVAGGVVPLHAVEPGGQVAGLEEGTQLTKVERSCAVEF